MSNTRHLAPSERLPLRGDLQLEVRKGSRVVRRIALRNTITYQGRNSLLYLLGQTIGTPGDWRMDRLVPGTNGTPPTVGDIAMGAPLGISDQLILAPSNLTISPATGELIVVATLDTTQGNGSTLREAGIQLANGQLFARQVHPAVPKDALLTVTYTWRVATTS